MKSISFASLSCRWLLAVLALSTPPMGELAAQLEISGQVDVVARHGYDQPLTSNFRRDDPLNELRFRLMASRSIGDNVLVFAELLYDIGSEARVNGAYLVATDLLGREWLNTRIGLAPSPIGSFGTRSTYFNVNPLIAAPMVWQYRSTLDAGARANAQELMTRKERNSRGLPLLYESCWNVQWELMGSFGRFDYSLAATPGSATNPVASRSVNGAQGMGRIGVRPFLGMRLGLNAAWGPYIGESFATTGVAAPITDTPEDYAQTLFGYDAELARGSLQLFSEGYWSAWETPNIASGVEAKGAYIEGRYDLAAQWYLASRLDAIWFNEIDVPGAGGTVSRQQWDDDVWRVESALGFRFSREVLAKLAWQHYGYKAGAGPNMDVVAVQVSAVF
jgi:hypothetical protein